MSIEQLKEDLEGIITRCPSGQLVTAAEMAKFQKDELLPLFLGMLEEIEDVDAALGAVIEHSEDLLHEASAKVFEGVIESGRRIAAALKARLTAADTEASKEVDEFLAHADEAGALLDEITYADPDQAEVTETEQ